MEEAGLAPGSYGTHTMRRTKASLTYGRTRSLRAVRLLLGHTKLKSTVRYLCIEVDDALEIASRLMSESIRVAPRQSKVEERPVAVCSSSCLLMSSAQAMFGRTCKGVP